MMDTFRLLTVVTVFIIFADFFELSEQSRTHQTNGLSLHTQNKRDAHLFLVREKRDHNEGENENICDTCTCSSGYYNCNCPKCSEFESTSIQATTTVSTSTISTTGRTTLTPSVYTSIMITSAIENDSGTVANVIGNTNLYIGLALGLIAVAITVVATAIIYYRRGLRRTESKFKLMTVSSDRELSGNENDIQNVSMEYEGAGRLRFLYELPPVPSDTYNSSSNVYDVGNASGRRIPSAVSDDNYDHAGCWNNDYTSTEVMRRINMKNKEIKTHNIYLSVDTMKNEP